MSGLGHLAFSLGLAMIAAPLSAQPLFEQDAPLSVTLSGPFRDIARNAARSTAPQQGMVAVGEEAFAVRFSARGLSRRQSDICDFPPIRVEFVSKPPAGSTFAGQERLKLVTHCRDSDRFETFALKEYTAYRLYNRLTPASFKVRLARIRYVDGSRPIAERHGFFIEDIDDVGKRVGGKEVEANAIAASGLDPVATTRVALFQYMIGNLDWAFLRGPAGSSCCHNSKLLAADPARPANAVPVPYDFDFSGLVDAPYATAPDKYRDADVKKRRYYGLCRHRAALPGQVADFLAARAALEGEIAATPGLPAQTRSTMLRYLAGFFDDIESPEKVEKKLLRDCS